MNFGQNNQTLFGGVSQGIGQQSSGFGGNLYGQNGPSNNASFGGGINAAP